MKHLNFNFKSIVQRKARWLLTLIAILTLGVGQMWALSDGETWYEGNTPYLYFNNINSNYNGVSLVQGRQYTYGSDGIGSQGYAMTAISNTKLYYIHQGLYDHYTTQCFVDRNGGSGWADWSSTAVASRVTTYAHNYTNSYNLTYTSDKVYVFTAASSSKNASLTKSVDAASGYSSLNKTITVKAKVSTDGGSTYSTATSPGSLSASSNKFTAYNSCASAQSLSSGTITCGYTATTTLTADDATGYTFRGWYDSSGTRQTTSKTLTIYPTADATYYAYYEENRYSLTFSHDGNGTVAVGGSTISAGSTANVNHFTTKTLAATANTGYRFTGWTVTGTNNDKVTIADKTSSGTSTTIKATGAGATVTAGFTKKTYAITLDKGDGDADGEATIQRGDGALTISSHASKDDWNLVGYWTSEGDQLTDDEGNLIADVGDYTDEDGNWIYDDDATLTAHWSQTYSLTVNAGSNISSVTGSNADVTLNSKYAISATPLSGYSFSGWTASPVANGEFDDASSASTNVTVKNGNVIVTGAATENLTIVTVNVSPAGAGTLTLDAAAFTPGNTTTAGVTTGHTVVATANSGYTFLGWYKDGNAAGTSSTRTITLKGNGSAGTGTLTAVFASNASAGWYLIGGPFGNNWGTDNHSYPMNLKYRGMSSVYMRVVDFGGVSNQYFKPLNNSTIYGQSSGSDVAVVTGTQYAITSTSSDGTAFKTNGQSTVWCIVDATNKKFWVQTPENYFPVTLSNGSSGNTLSGTEGTIALTTNNYGNLATTYYSVGERINISVTAKSGYWIDDISINGVSVVENRNSSSWSGYTTMPSANATLTVTYNRIYTLSYNANGGSGAAPATTTHISGTNANAASNTFTARAYYTFGGWNTAQYITGTNYAAGASVPMTANTTLYAKWTRTITLNQEDATIEGTTSVTGTYNCATLPSITNPEKEGYVFGGWRTEVGGGGNLVINTSGELQSGVYHWTDQTTPSNRFDRTTTKDGAPLYAMWTQTVTLNANTANHGDGSNTTATIVYKATAKTSITHCTPATGYHLVGYYTAATDGTKILEANGNFADEDIDDYIEDGKWVKAGATTLYAHYEGNTYDVILKPNGATTGSDQTVTATFGSAMPTTQKTSGDPITAPSKTGYDFSGYTKNSNGTGTQYYTAGLASNNVWDVATNNTNIYAKWSAKSYTVTLDVDEPNHGNIEDVTESHDVTYDASTTTIPTRPTAANGYAFMGYYTDQAGGGQKVINADGTWIESVTGYTDASANWVRDDDDVTLYAYYKKAEITNLTPSVAAVAPNTDITVTPTIEPTPTGDTKLCYEIQFSNGTALTPQPTMSVNGSNVLTVRSPGESATYRVEAKLYTGTTCGSGTLLSTYATTFQVAGSHEVTVRYQDADGRTLAASSSVTAQPLDWSEGITAPSVVGYKFHHWVLGDGITINSGASQSAGDKDTEGTATINIKASYAGTLTAVYTKKRVIYFNNTLDWSSVYVYFYKNDSYWESTGSARGSGSKTTSTWTNTPYSEGLHGQMTNIAGTKIYYFDAEAAGVNASYDDVVFTEANQHNYEFFYNTKAVRRGDYNSTDLPMFVPLKDQSPDTHNGTKYYNSGYWMNYPENTGYTLKIYDQKAKSGAKKLRDIPFEFTADYTMPMELNVYLDASHTYGFEIKRADDLYYSNGTTYTANTTSSTISTGQSTYCGLTTTAAGDYTISLYYSSSNYKIDVTYPVAVNDYRIVYTDAARWSKAATSHYHPSGVITKNGSATEKKQDIVSFFWAYGSSPAIKYQKCTATGAGSVTWNTGTAIDVSAYSSVLTKSGVYNFIFEQPAGGASISLVGVEPYTGNYYIRTDIAGSTKWSDYQSLDHQMTYSDYAEDNWNYSHYYCHWVTSGTNVKFVIANDYSPCISDTLAADYSPVIANITAEGYADAGRLNSADANIRFMWNQSTNKISRAYIGGSGDITKKFLVLEGDAKMYDENGNALTGEHQDHDKWGTKLGTDNQVILHDDENFVYERTIQVNTTARARLSALYNSQTQYFIGSSGAFADGTTVELLGGSASGKHNMRIVYDFKTNRLVRAYVPSGTIEDDIEINADLMLVREHQEAGEQLTFNGGSLTEVKTVYGVMRFNRWTLNNKSTAAGHAVLADPKSAYQRGLYWISFPFNVNLSDVFGFGTYGVDWIIQYYDGEGRAEKGYWIDSPSFWRYVTDRTNFVLKAGKGYVLALDLDRMKSDNEDFWVNNIEQVELFFPSAENVGGIEATNVKTTVEEHECTINRHTQAEQDAGTDTNINKNRTKADSHWNMIGIPSYANYGTTLTSDGSTVITWRDDPGTADLPYLYEWNMVDNTYTAKSGSTYPFKAMHAYMVQYHGDIYWTLASATPASIVARRTYAERPQSTEFRLELQQNDKMIDQTFVKLSNDENASAKFIFDEDLCKEYNGTKANIYTFIEGYIPAAGNTLPMSEQTTVVPVGVQIKTDGEYTFAMPEGTEGIGVTLIDNVANTRTNLGLTDYTVTLSAGTIDNRFVLEISPIQHTPTDIDNVQGETTANGARKVMIDGILYIIKDGKVFDATGALVK